MDKLKVGDLPELNEENAIVTLEEALRSLEQAFNKSRSPKETMALFAATSETASLGVARSLNAFGIKCDGKVKALMHSFANNVQEPHLSQSKEEGE